MVASFPNLAKVTVENVYKIYRSDEGRSVTVVRNASFEIKDGEFVVLVGPFGCGKASNSTR